MLINPENLRSLRLSRGWTQSHLAEIADVSLRTIQRVERDGNASQETVMSLAAVLEVTPKTLQEKISPASSTRLSMRYALMIGVSAFLRGTIVGVSTALLI